MARLRYILTILAIFAITTAFGSEPKQMLNAVEKYNGFDYTYYSPALLQITPSEVPGNLQGYPIDKLDMVEIVTTSYGSKEKALQLADSVVNENDLKILATTKVETLSITWYASIEGTGKKAVVKKFFVVRSDIGFLSMIYLVGNLNFADVKRLMQ